MNYEIKGGNLPVVCCQLAKGESVQCEAGAMAWIERRISPVRSRCYGLDGSRH